MHASNDRQSPPLSHSPGLMAGLWAVEAPASRQCNTMEAVMSKPQRAKAKLSDAQLVILSAAAQRPDGSLLPLPDSLATKGAALNRVMIEILCKRNLAEERPSIEGAPEWRRNRGGEPLGLFITKTGLRALELDHAREKKSSRADESTSRQRKTANAKSRAGGFSKQQDLVVNAHAALKERWRVLQGGDPPRRLSRQFLLRALAHAIQEKAFGGLSPTVRQRLQRLAAELRNTGCIASFGTRPAFKPGTRLIREWQDRTHEVIVLEHGFKWKGATYRSLSAIARAITDTKWNGHVFFGLKPRRSPYSIADSGDDRGASGTCKAHADGRQRDAAHG